jgi:ketosteroid isomerase-like protein
LDFWPGRRQAGPESRSDQEVPMTGHEQASAPEEITRLFVERSNAGDAAGVAALYEQDAVVAYPPGGQTTGRAAIQALWEKVLSRGLRFEPEEPLPTLVSGDIALTSTVARDGTGVRVQVLRRQPDGSWLRLLDQPELSPPPVILVCPGASRVAAVG